MITFSKKELQIEMLRRNCSVEDLAQILGISKQATYKKMHNQIAFSIKDIRRIKKAWTLGDNRIVEIFLI